MKEQSKHEKHTTVLRRRHIRVQRSDSSKRDSVLSMFSDTSSVAESSLVDEDLVRSHSGDNLTTSERNRLSTEISKPVVSNLRHSLIHSPTTSRSQLHQFRNIDDQALEPVRVTEGVQESNLEIEVPVTEVPVPTHSGEETHLSKPTFRSGSSPDIDITSTTKLNTSEVNPVSRTRLYSEPYGSTKQTRMQGLKRETKVKPYSQTRAAVMTHQKIECEELSQILDKRRKKIDSESETSNQHVRPPANTQ